MSDWKPSASKKTLRKRARMLRKTRLFFERRGVLEAETPLLSAFPAPDLHLDSFEAGELSRPLYLATSPEYHMKRLLAAGSGSIYQICKAFRLDEAGPRHNPEFTIIEWYREGWDHLRLMAEVEELLTELLKTTAAERASYEEIFRRTLDVNPFKMDFQSFLKVCAAHDLPIPDYLSDPSVSRDETLNYLMGALIEPRLGADRPLFVFDYPSSQSLMARAYPDRPEKAMRFEVYYQGRELGNGCRELNDSREQLKRFLNENKAREKAGKKETPIDHRLIAALEAGLPDCSGAALGFDRIVAAACGKKTIGEVMAFPWECC